MGWGVPPASARVAGADRGGQRGHLLRADRAGADDGAALAVVPGGALPFHTKSALSFTVNGGKLFDAAVSWALAC